MKKLWRLEMAVGNPNILEMFIYGYVQGDSYNYWTGEDEVSETSANYFRDELAKYPDAKEIKVYVNSYGGSVFEAMAIRNQLKRHGATVTGYVDGFAASAASFILTACDTVKMYSNTMQMLHNMIGMAFGNSTALRKSADDQDAIMNGVRQAYLEKSNGKLEEQKLIEILDNETWLTAADCLEYGLCDEIIDKNVDMTAAKSMLEKANMSLEQHISRNKELSLRIKELVPKVLEKEPEPTPAPPKQLTNVEKMMAAFKKL